jgi:hypothetical protein
MSEINEVYMTEENIAVVEDNKKAKVNDNQDVTAVIGVRR